MIKPMVRNNICLNAHPAGCVKMVERQIEYAEKNLSKADNAPTGVPKLALIVGCSNGYGLASRICAAFGYKAVTVGLSFENEPSEKRSGTPGFYNNEAFDKEAAKAGLVSITLNGDAYSNEMKTKTAEAVKQAAAKAGIPAKIDLFVYSLASPARTDPKDGVMYKSVIKPIGSAQSGRTLNFMDGTFGDFSIEPATEEEISNTVKVMGGEDWELWMDALNSEGLFSPQSRTVAYTYIGPELSWAIYKNGTIGKAKEDLERACRDINKKYAEKISGAWVSVNKALVTRASAVIPIIPLYISSLFKVMKDKGLHEGCIEQIARLYRDFLYTADGKVPVDSENRIRIDDWEMRDDVQKAVTEIMQKATAENVFTETDVAGVKHDFLEVHGFDVAGVDYEA
ncbi:MAG: trans-2-enoyl-CoA reductase family protein [Treponema sp.]|jgi:enoyl-[acyl-carrier protein] reductase/trans-2-enoyl-CoA reductase (NAD+)|nr:trans-2-enoyl-CoA reductase family protein [Treponema sp.]